MYYYPNQWYQYPYVYRLEEQEEQEWEIEKKFMDDMRKMMYQRKRQKGPTWTTVGPLCCHYFVFLGIRHSPGMLFDQGRRLSIACSSVLSIKGSCSRTYVK